MRTKVFCTVGIAVLMVVWIVQPGLSAETNQAFPEIILKGGKIFPETDSRPVYDLYIRGPGSNQDFEKIASGVLEARRSAQGPIAFLTEEGKLFFTDPVGLKKTFLADRVMGGLTWSPEGERLAYTAHPPDGIDATSVIYVLDAVPGTPRLLVPGPGSASRPFWSADGEILYFVWGKTGLASIWSIPASGGEAKQMTNVGLSRGTGKLPERFVPVPIGPDPAIATPGGWLVYESGEGIWAVKDQEAKRLSDQGKDLRLEQDGKVTCNTPQGRIVLPVQ